MGVGLAGVAVGVLVEVIVEVLVGVAVGGVVQVTPSVTLPKSDSKCRDEIEPVTGTV